MGNFNLFITISLKEFLCVNIYCRIKTPNLFISIRLNTPLFEYTLNLQYKIENVCDRIFL